MFYFESTIEIYRQLVLNKQRIDSSTSSAKPTPVFVQFVHTGLHTVTPTQSVTLSLASHLLEGEYLQRSDSDVRKHKI